MPYLDSSKRPHCTLLFYIYRQISLVLSILYHYMVFLRSFGVKIKSNIFLWNLFYFKVSFIMRIETVLCSRDAERERDTEVTKKLKFSMFVISLSRTPTCLHCSVLFPTSLQSGQTKHKFSTVSMASHIDPTNSKFHMIDLVIVYYL